MSEKYFKELARILSKNGVQTAPPEKSSLPILLDGHPACHVEPNGGLCKFPDDLNTPASNELYHKATPIARMVKEYMTAMEQAPLLQAPALDDDFRLLAEFNGAVLAGRETEYGYMFVTWERDYDGTDVINGEYCLDGYTEAKQDFAVRAGLVEKQRLFTNEQLLDIYQSVNDTFDAGYELTKADAKQLNGIQNQIEDLLPDVYKRIDDIQQKAFERLTEQTMF